MEQGPSAHTAADRPWEPLEDHLRDVETLARQFASAFDAGDWGGLLGRWHDLGKNSAAFQPAAAKCWRH